MEILETSRFVKLADDYLGDDELDELKMYLAINPSAGVVIPASGGCRKLRWRRQGRGKSGGSRDLFL